MNDYPLKSREVVALLGTTFHRLCAALRSGKVDPLPAKDASGDFRWLPPDVERARAALAVDRRFKANKLPAPSAQGVGHVG